MTPKDRYLCNLRRDGVVGVRNVSLRMTPTMAGRAFGARHKVRFTTHLTFATDGIGLFRNVVSPKPEAFVHVVPRNGTTLEVRLQSNAGREGHLVRIGQSRVRVRAERNRTQPFVAPPSS